MQKKKDCLLLRHWKWNTVSYLFCFVFFYYRNSEQSCRPKPSKRTIFVDARDTMQTLQNGTEYLKMITSTSLTDSITYMSFNEFDTRLITLQREISIGWVPLFLLLLILKRNTNVTLLESSSFYSNSKSTFQKKKSVCFFLDFNFKVLK